MAAVPEAPKEAPNTTGLAQTGPTYVLPGLEKGPASFFETESKSYWIGIPVERVDLLTAWAVLDSVKLNILQTYQQEAARSKLAKPHWSEKAKQNGKALLQKLGLH